MINFVSNQREIGEARQGGRVQNNVSIAQLFSTQG